MVQEDELVREFCGVHVEYIEGIGKCLCVPIDAPPDASDGDAAGCPSGLAAGKSIEPQLEEVIAYPTSSSSGINCVPIRVPRSAPFPRLPPLVPPPLKAVAPWLEKKPASSDDSEDEAPRK